MRGVGAALAMCTLLYLLFYFLLSQRIYCLDFVMAGTWVLLQEYALDADMTHFRLLITMPVIFVSHWYVVPTFFYKKRLIT